MLIDPIDRRAGRSRNIGRMGKAGRSWRADLGPPDQPRNGNELWSLAPAAQRHASGEMVGRRFSIQQVAADLGYESVPSFVTMFHKAPGTSPGRFMAERHIGQVYKSMEIKGPLADSAAKLKDWRI